MSKPVESRLLYGKIFIRRTNVNWIVWSWANNLLLGAKIRIENILFFNYIVWLPNWKAPSVKCVYFWAISRGVWSVAQKLHISLDVAFENGGIQWGMTFQSHIFVSPRTRLFDMFNSFLKYLICSFAFSKLGSRLLQVGGRIGSWTWDRFHFIYCGWSIKLAYKRAIPFLWQAGTLAIPWVVSTRPRGLSVIAIHKSIHAGPKCADRLASGYDALEFRGDGRGADLEVCIIYSSFDYFALGIVGF